MRDRLCVVMEYADLMNKCGLNEYLKVMASWYL